MTYRHDGRSDVIIVGAGLSGIGVAVHLARECPWLTIQLLEMRDDIGGTWDLFRYPGLRSDSDMFTLGYDFKPWNGAKAIADGRDILSYIRETAAEFDVFDRISFGARVTKAAWKTDDAEWVVESVCPHTGTEQIRRCGFLFMCAGYYSYKSGYRPHFENEENFGGRIVHPQNWPADLDYSSKRIAVIGSGATAVTLLPVLAAKAAKVSMVQKSPGYVASVPSRDRVMDVARNILPAGLAYALGRFKNILASVLIFNLSKAFPRGMKKLLLKGVRNELGDRADIARDWTPHYNPWDERLCAAPDGDLFEALRSGRADVVTGAIERFTSDGIRMTDGREVPADIIVTATGLNMVFLGEIVVTVDGAVVHGGDKLIYKGCMFDGVPNLAYAFGYTNSSWTLKVDLTAKWVARLLKHMRRKKVQIALPVRAVDMSSQDASGLKSEYIKRAAALLPKQGSKRPWRLHDNYFLDWWEFKVGGLNDGVLRLSQSPSQKSRSATTKSGLKTPENI